MHEVDKRLSAWHEHAVNTKFLQYFTIFTRILLAIAFIPSGLTKILGEPFTAMAEDTPVGFFFAGFFQAKAYYAFVGWAQFAAALLLLIPATASLGAVMYLPIILNIWLITLSLHFQGTVYITTFMLLGSLYLLCWEYPRIRLLLPIHGVRKSKPKASVYWLQMALWAVLAVLVYALAWYENVANIRQQIGVLGFAVALVAGAGFGAFLTWQVGQLRYLKRDDG